MAGSQLRYYIAGQINWNKGRLTIENNQLNHEIFLRYLGILIDSNLSWKCQVRYFIQIVKKLKRNISILSKLRYYLNLDNLVHLYNTLIYPFLVYGLNSVGNTYPSSTRSLFVCFKKESNACNNVLNISLTLCSLLFKRLNIIKIPDLFTKSKGRRKKIYTTHNYNTMLA